MQQPPGFEQYCHGKRLVCRFHKAIYGLKQAPRAWFDRLKLALLHLGYLQSKANASLFVKHDKNLIIYFLVYVDDIIITCNKATQIKDLICQLNSQFSLKHLGNLSYFLGIEVSRLSHTGLFLSQSKYIYDLLKRTKMDSESQYPPLWSLG